MTNLTISYQTCRKDCRIEWFIESLMKQPPASTVTISSVVIVDFWHLSRWREWKKRFKTAPFEIIHVPPKPCVWQGDHRLTKNNYFAPSNARNTALCYAKDGWIAYVDDISVLAPTWLTAVERAVQRNYVVCGAFRKVNKLVVEGGIVKSFEDHQPGHDSRWNEGKDTHAIKCPPNWLFGCSCAMPVPALEKINGWPEAVCDSTGVGAEDCFVGMALVGTGHRIGYDRRMFTYESEELHHQEPKMLRADKGNIGTPVSKSHAAVRMLQHCLRFDNDFSPFPDVAALRCHILGGGSFPVPKTPLHDWYDGEPLKNL